MTNEEANTGGAAPSFDPNVIVRTVRSAEEARSLPSGSIIGDLYGGLTFTDAVSAALEARSICGWREFRTLSGDIWTIIILDR
ncbi:MAG: hypothetical protein JO323_22645 [Acidobacteriia bacterium]|nr:hypothetical protein [Terriglobia bacterium]